MRLLSRHSDGSCWSLGAEADINDILFSIDFHQRDAVSQTGVNVLIVNHPGKIQAYRKPQFLQTDHPESIKNPTSSHIKGLAVDIKAKDSKTRGLILDALRYVGFTRIGISKTFIHVDLDYDKSQNVTWLY